LSHGYKTLSEIKAGTIKTYLTGVRHYCLSLGIDISAFGNERLKCLQRGIQKTVRTIKRPRLPITVWLLKRLITQLDPRNMNHLVLGVAILFGFFGLLRAGEFTQKKEGTILLRQNIIWSNEFVGIYLKNSKQIPLAKELRLEFIKLEVHSVRTDGPEFYG